jgi:uncharacterized protein
MLALPPRWLTLFALLIAIIATPAWAQDFPPLTGRVVDAANIISPATEAALDQKLAALETQSQRQLVVATIPDLGGNDIADYSYRLGRAWGIGNKDRNDGVLLVVAPNERRVNIAVGYGLEPVLTDALSATIIRNTITPRFRAGDYDGGITAGVDAIAHQITLPPEEAARVAQQAQAARDDDSGGSAGMIFFWLFIGFIILIIILSNRGGGRRYRSRGGPGPVVIWGGPGWGGGSGGGSSWGGGGFGGGGFGGGGFGGGGGSFGGGGASGGW